MNDKARQHILAAFIIILLVLCVFSSIYTFPIRHAEAASNNKPWFSSPSPVNASTDNSIQPTLSIYVNDTDGDSMDLTWYEGNYTTLSNITFISDKHSDQGIAVNDTYYWTSAGDDNFHIWKYWVSNDTEVLNRDVETDLPDAVNQVNSLYLDEENNLLYVGANNYSAPTGTQGWIAVFNADDLTYSTIHSLPGRNMTEGCSYHNGSWWVVDDFETRIWNYDSSWNHVANYTLSYSLTGTIHDGYNGVTWYGDDIFVGAHNLVDQEFVVDRYHWNGNGFDEVRRYLSVAGDLPDGCDQGIYYYDGYFYSCMRNVQGANIDGICKLELTGWNEIQQNNTINNGTYTCEFNNATIYNHTYYWKINITDGTDTNESWFSFTTDSGLFVTTNATTDVTYQNATLHGYLDNDGGETCRVGFYYNSTVANNRTADYNISLSSGWTNNLTFPTDIWNFNSSIASNDTCENFCQQGGIYDDIFGINRENGETISWLRDREINELTNIDNYQDYPEYVYHFYVLNATNLSFVYDDMTNNSGEEFSLNIFDLSPGVLYYYRAFATNSTGTVYGDDLAFLTKPLSPTNFTSQTNYPYPNLNLSWTKGTGANSTYIERNISADWSRGEGTLVYNDTGAYYNDTGLSWDTTYYYQVWSYTNWTYNPTLWQFSSGYSQDNITYTYTIGPPYNGQSEYDYPYLNLTWSRDNRSIQEIVVSRNDTWSTSAAQSGNWIRQNSTNTWFNASETQMRYYTIWSYNLTDNIYSSIGLNIPWGGLTLNCYDEETNGSLWFDVFISNQDGSQTYESRNNSNSLILDISQLPVGDDIKITVSAASNYSEKSETSYWSVDENQTITYIILSQTADSKSSTNITCINVSDDAYSYPPFTLDGDLITILPDDADNFTKIFVNYTHEEYGSRLYYRDIEINTFGILNTYLPPTEDKQLYLLEVIDEASNTVSDAHIEVKRSVNGTYVIVSRLLTDANGQADIDLISDRNYIFIISKTGYITENASWTPGTQIFTHTFKIIWETTPIEPDTFGDIINFYGTLYVNNTMMVTFYDLDNAMSNSHFIIYENYNDTLTYMGEYNGTTSNDIVFWINVTNATRLHIVVLYMNHSTLGEVINYRVVVYPVHVDRDEGNWLENLIRSVVGDFDYGYVITFIWYLPCVLLVVGLAAIKHPGIGILGAGFYSIWITWYLFIPEEAKILTFASIALVTGSITLFLVKGKKVIH